MAAAGLIIQLATARGNGRGAAELERLVRASMYVKLVTMLTIVITACREEKTIGKAIESLLAQELPAEWELLVVCPDVDTAAVAEEYVRLYPPVRCLRDRGEGKPAALNLVLNEARGDILLLSDGDVYVGHGAPHALLAPFGDPQVGIVSGRPMSLSSRNTMLGYWSHLLVDAGAHRQRELRAARGEFLECSGYLYAFRRSLVTSIPDDSLAEDGLISHRIWEQGYYTAYAPQALVYVKYPTSYGDWTKQKIRSMGGYAQNYVRASRGMRSIRREALDGTCAALHYAQSPRELCWTLLLFLARLHVWLRVWWDVKCRKKAFSVLWQRVNSTK
jgi:cellulose synthase/poly-beta-1,6-N-acetylglucosamine synthase-like glycosyltransferase